MFFNELRFWWTSAPLFSCLRERCSSLFLIYFVFLEGCRFYLFICFSIRYLLSFGNLSSNSLERFFSIVWHLNFRIDMVTQSRRKCVLGTQFRALSRSPFSRCHLIYLRNSLKTTRKSDDNFRTCSLLSIVCIQLFGETVKHVSSHHFGDEETQVPSNFMRTVNTFFSFISYLGICVNDFFVNYCFFSKI